MGSSNIFIRRLAFAVGRTLGTVITRSGEYGRLSILIYHRVLPKPDSILESEVDALTFDAQTALITEVFNVLPLAEAIERLHSKRLPARALSITFDDGYADNAEVALPILNRRRIPATFFVSTGFLNGGLMWNDIVIETIRRTEKSTLDLTKLQLGKYSLRTIEQKRCAIDRLLAKLKYLHPVKRNRLVSEIGEIGEVPLPESAMMSTDQVVLLHRSGMQIGGHTVSHPILSVVDDATAQIEISKNKSQLEDIIGSPVTLFAYPNGKPGIDYTSDHVKLVKDTGFTAAVSTSWGASTGKSDIYQLPRFTPWDRNPIKFTLRLLQNAFLNETQTA